MEAMWSRFLPTYRKVQDALKNGEIGTVRFAQSNFGYNIMGIDRIKNPDMGGGALLDIGYDWRKNITTHCGLIPGPLEVVKIYFLAFMPYRLFYLDTTTKNR